MSTTIQQAPQRRRVTVIPADPQTTERDIRKKHLRVAPYCRVSTDSEEQLNSYNAQITYYTEKIAATPEWTMVRLYDEEIQRVNMAKTSLMAKKAELEREGRTTAAFNQRMEDITRELEQSAGTITEFDEVTVRQLISNIKVVSKDTLLICFKDGTEITQTV